MFRYFNVKVIDGKRFYDEHVVLSDLAKVKTLDQMRSAFSGMEEREKQIYAKMFFDRFSQMGGMR